MKMRIYPYNLRIDEENDILMFDVDNEIWYLNTMMNIDIWWKCGFICKLKVLIWRMWFWYLMMMMNIDCWWKCVFICKWKVLMWRIWFWYLLMMMNIDVLMKNACFICKIEGIDVVNVILIFDDDDEYWYVMKMLVYK